MNFAVLTLCLAFWGAASLAAGNDEELPIVKTENGELLGKVDISRSGRKYHSFMGIPFAQPPERFQPPKPALKWTDVRNASELGPMCVQDIWGLDYVQTVAGSEDCLSLNVQTPNSKSAKKMPVLVLFHGGGFMFGTSGLYEGKYLMDHDIVYVTVNYRLGAFGFLDTGDGVVSGNNGMKDQVLALKWVQKNVANFGGDPNQVTITGHSAGSASAIYHMISPMSKGLFHRVLGLSGSATSPWALITKPKYFAERLGAKLNCPTGTSTELVECLKTRDAKEFAEQHFRRWNLDTAFPFAPTKESSLEKGDVFLSEDPLSLLQKGDFSNIPVLLSVTEDEGLFFHAGIVLQSEKLTKQLDEDWNRIAPITLLYDAVENRVTEAQQNDWSNKIRKFYFGDKKVGMDTARELINCYSDRWFVHSVRTTARILASKSTKESPVYTFEIGYRNEKTALEKLGVKNISGVFSGTTHADELPFLFNTVLFPDPLTKPSEDFSKRLVQTCADFVKSGEFIVDGKKLEPLSPNTEPEWYNLDENPVELKKSPIAERMQFWDGLLNIKFNNKTEL